MGLLDIALANWGESGGKKGPVSAEPEKPAKKCEVIPSRPPPGPLVWDDPEWLEVAEAVDGAFLPPGPEPPEPSRPETLPTHGLTVSGHVVELPRTAREAKVDLLKLVSRSGWPRWYCATEADHRYVRNVEKAREPDPVHDVLPVDTPDVEPPTEEPAP